MKASENDPLTEHLHARYVTTIDQVHPSDLAPYPGNPKLHDMDALQDSITTNGQYRSVLARRLPDGTLQLLAGHGTTDAIHRAGTTVRVEVVDADDDQARRIVLADNAIGARAGYDDAALLSLLDQASAAGGLAGTGYDDSTYQQLLGQAAPNAWQPEGDPDDIPDPPRDPVSRPGDLWQLGRHRLTCGDSTRADTWSAVLGPDRPHLVFTDPPYGIAYKAMRGGRTIENDASPGEALAVTRKALTHLKDTPAHFVCCDWRSHATIIEAMLEVGIEPKATIIWDKKVRIQNLDRYAKRHEFIVYAGPYGGQPTLDTDVWECARDFNPDHPTPKPVELVARALTTASQRGDIVADPFGGSGATLIAAEATDRQARLVELDPRYCDVIARRWADLTSRPALRNGEPVDWPGHDAPHPDGRS